MRRVLITTMAVVLALAAGTVAAQMQRRGEPLGLGEMKAQLQAPPLVPPPITRSTPARVIVELETVETTGVLADGVEYAFWTFNGTVPGPLLRVREGDSVQIRLSNRTTSHNTHSIDLHAVTGPGGGAAVTQIMPGERGDFEWKALNPGLYVYHCATPHVPIHIANGMYGMVLVEPAKGLPRVDREFYVMQGEFYTQGRTMEGGLQAFDADKARDERPEYVLFNGRMGALLAEGALQAKTGETIRLFVGNGGPNLVSSFHVIGEVFDRVYPEASMGADVKRNVQTTLIPAGGAAIAELTAEVPGRLLLVDHAISRAMDKGALGSIVVTGDERPDIFKSLTPAIARRHSGH
jgi:nitrite reductase (NO-forming)